MIQDMIKRRVLIVNDSCLTSIVDGIKLESLKFKDGRCYMEIACEKMRMTYKSDSTTMYLDPTRQMEYHSCDLVNKRFRNSDADPLVIAVAACIRAILYNILVDIG